MMLPGGHFSTTTMITQAKRLKSDLINVVLYLRMSSDKQDTSIDDQRAELLAYAAKHGYTIVREYIDEGISGWKSRQRKGFTHLIADAALGEFQIVLVWDQSRFSRFEPLEASFYWHQLKVAGVSIVTTKEGLLDFDSLGGWLTASVQQHGKAEYCRSLGIDVARGQRAQKAKGFWIHPAPYGYRKPPGKEVKLVLGPPEEVATIRRIFQLRLEGYGARRIVQKLNAEGIRPQRAAAWHYRSLTKIFENQTYVGDSVSGEQARPQFASKPEVKVIKNTHPAIIDREDFERVQKQGIGKVGKRSRAEPNREGLPLAGLMKCGACGGGMYAQGFRGTYVCGKYLSHSGCHCHQISNAVAMRLVASAVREHVLYGTLERLTEVIAQRLAKRAKEAPKVDAAEIRKQMAAIDSKLEAAAERLVSVAPSLVKTVEAKMLDLQRQREGLQERLQAKPKPRKQPSAKVIAAEVWKLDDLLRDGSPTRIRHALRQLIEGFEVRFQAFPTKGKRVVRRPESGVIHFSMCDTLSGSHVTQRKTVKVSPREFAAAAAAV